MTLDTLAPGIAALVSKVAWDELEPGEARRLRALGMDTGAQVSVEHRGVFGTRDPLAVRLGGTMLALRRSHALAISVDISDDAPVEAQR